MDDEYETHTSEEMLEFDHQGYIREDETSRTMPDAWMPRDRWASLSILPPAAQELQKLEHHCNMGGVRYRDRR